MPDVAWLFIIITAIVLTVCAITAFIENGIRPR